MRHGGLQTASCPRSAGDSAPCQTRDGTAILSRRHQFDDKATCVATLAGHSYGGSSVAFHATEPLIVAGSSDGTA